MCKPVVEQAPGMSQDDLAAMRKQMEEDIRAQLEANTQNTERMNKDEWNKALEEVMLLTHC